jgi:hypothetical protein
MAVHARRLFPAVRLAAGAAEPTAGPLFVIGSGPKRQARSAKMGRDRAVRVSVQPPMLAHKSLDEHKPASVAVQWTT